MQPRCLGVVDLFKDRQTVPLGVFHCFEGFSLDHNDSYFHCHCPLFQFDLFCCCAKITASRRRLRASSSPAISVSYHHILKRSCLRITVFLFLAVGIPVRVLWYHIPRFPNSTKPCSSVTRRIGRSRV